MATRRTARRRGFEAPDDRPLIGVPVERQGREVVHYFTDEAGADAAEEDEALVAALSAVGAFSDLDWDEMQDAVDRIRHGSAPTLPIVDL